MKRSIRPLVEMMALGGWIYRDAHYLVADVELDAERASRFLPWPLKLAKPARAQVFTAYFPSTTFGSVYRESGVFFEVGRRRAIYCPWMVVDDDVALIIGRELLGYPKKLGEVTWNVGEQFENVVSRRGHRLLSMRGTLGAVIAEPPPVLGRPHRNVRSTFGLAIPKLVAFTPKERVVEVRAAEIELEISGSERDPLHELGIGHVVAGRLHRVDIGGSRLPIPIGVVSPLAYARDLLLRSR